LACQRIITGVAGIDPMEFPAINHCDHATQSQCSLAKNVATLNVDRCDTHISMVARKGIIPE
jgi:hypothetical protein